MSNVLELRDLSVRSADIDILKNISISFPENKISALIGPSGSGKTTLIRSINRLIDEDNNLQFSGEVKLSGEDLSDLSYEELRKKVGIVFQTPSPFPMSIEKNMSYALNYHSKLKKGEVRDIIEEKLKLSGLYDEVKNRMGDSAKKLSGGQQQRLCIARALTLDPKVLLLDEPCSSLDPRSSSKVEETILKLSKEVTVIMITHNISQAKRIADNVAFLSGGRIIDFRPKTEFFSDIRESEIREFLKTNMG